MRAIVLLAILGVSACSVGETERGTTAEAATSPPLLTGVVKSQSGEVMGGVTVSAKVSGAPITVSVFTDQHGAYYFPPLNDTGRYVVWAQAVGFERNATEVDIGHGVATANFALRPTDQFLPQLSGWQQAKALPEDTREQRRGKAIVLKACISCHQSSKVFAIRLDERGWQHLIESMARGVSASSHVRRNIEDQKEELAAYLAQMHGPGVSPMRLQLPARPSGEAVLPVIYEYDIANIEGGYMYGNGSDWSSGPPATAGIGGGLHDATVDLDGNLWFTSPGRLPGRTIGKIDALTGRTTSFAYPGEKPGSTGRSHAMILARDGTLWFTLAYGPDILTSHLGFMDPRTGEQHYYPVPEPMAAVGGWLNEDALGNIWAAAGSYSGSAGALRFDRKTKQFTQFKSLSDGMTYGVAGDSAGNGWWTQINVDIIGHANAATGKTSEIRLPFTWQGAPFLKPGDMSEKQYRSITLGVGPASGNSQAPRRMKADLRSDDVWIANYAGNNLMRIDIKTREATYYPAPEVGMAPYDIGVDSQHRVWVGLQNGDEVARFDPKSGEWVIYPFPTKGVSSRSLNVVERAGRIEVIVPENDAGKIGRLVLRSQEDIEALKASYYK